MKSLPSLAVANYFVKRAHEEDTSITPMQVIKLTYIAHGWHLGITGDPLIRESIEAWKYGPVIRSLYDHFRKYGSKPIETLASSWTPDGFGVVSLPSDESRIPLLDRVWTEYGKCSGGQLSVLTHVVGSPWHQVWEIQNGKDRLGTTIPDETIRAYYERKRQSA